MSAASPPLVELRQVTILREAQTALVDVDLRIESGEHVCILGPNGSGKSTLVKTLTRECYPQVREGSFVKLLGKERWDVTELRSHLGIVSPDFVAACEPGSTGRDVVVSGFVGATRVMPYYETPPELRVRAEAAMARAGIAHLADRLVSSMSSGEAKRTLIARALVHSPGTLLFDEPSNALDIGARSQLTGAMRDLARAGLGILLVTHHVSEIIPEIERVLLLDRGRVVADGPKREVLTEERLSALFHVPVRLLWHEGFAHAV